jgi:hypothetical protein
LALRAFALNPDFSAASSAAALVLEPEAESAALSAVALSAAALSAAALSAAALSAAALSAAALSAAALSAGGGTWETGGATEVRLAVAKKKHSKAEKDQHAQQRP